MRFLSPDERRIVTTLSTPGYHAFSDLLDKDFLKNLLIKFVKDPMYKRYEIKFYIRKSETGVT